MTLPMEQNPQPLITNLGFHVSVELQLLFQGFGSEVSVHPQGIKFKPLTVSPNEYIRYSFSYHYCDLC